MSQTPFEFEKVRDFGAVIGDALQFFARNFKSLLLGFLTYVGPFLLVGIIVMVYLGMSLQEIVSGESADVIIPPGMIALVPALLMASVMVFVFVVSAVQKYQRVSDEPIVIGLWPYLRRNLGPACIAMLVVLGILVVPVLLLGVMAYLTLEAAGLVIAIFILFPLIIYLVVPLSIFLVLHLYEKTPVLVSLRRAFFLVKDKWWITFAIYLVISLLAGIGAYVFAIPAYFVFFIQTLGAAESGEFGTGFGLWFGILYACQLLGSMFTSMYQVLGISLQYFSLREQKEGHGLKRRIEALDQPAGSNFV